ncbi:hypothetical protein BaRGS_00024595 [Batillaria attramentaria]|uniref:Uncharacterized protein n=1 Tax=Batillaria attramentaria TaxID=370345 RepID=A0ABD0KAF9_9CAEN
MRKVKIYPGFSDSILQALWEKVASMPKGGNVVLTPQRLSKASKSQLTDPIAASKQFAVPKSTLRDHAKGSSTLGEKAGRQTSIPKEVEDEIVEKVKSASAAVVFTVVFTL